MKGFIYILNKKNTEKPTKLITKLIDELKDTTHAFVNNKNDKLQSIFYTNKSNFNKNIYKNNKQISLIGQFIEEESVMLNNLSTLNNTELMEYINTLRGAFAIALSDYNSNSMSFFTHIFRIDNIFYFENENEVIVGTDPLIVSAVSNDDLKPKIDIDNSVSFLMNGFFADETTLFKDVKVMPPNSVMTVNSQGIKIDELDNSYSELFTEKPNKIINNQIKENYIEAFKAVPQEVDINIGVTGGKDSRLALLGLLEAGYNVKTNTRGFKDNPDVQMAQKLTEKLGLDHKVIEPKIMDSKGMTVNIEKRALQSMIATSGQVYGYENIQYQPKYKGNVGVTGVAALTMKGGYSNLNNVSPKSSYDELIKRFLPLDDLLIKGKSENYKNMLRKLGEDDFQVAQFKHAMLYRNGRWTSGTRLAKSYSSDVYSPYYDNLFTKSIMKVQKRFLDNGFTQYTLMNKLNKELSLFPLVGSRWGFEKEQPVKPENYNSWLNRAPSYPKTKLANYNWRNLTLPDNTVIRDEFERVLLSNPDHLIFQVVDYNKLKNLFAKKLTSRHLKFMWSILSLFAYVNYLNGLSITSKDLKITIPETIVSETTNTPETIDLTREIHSTNNDVVIMSATRKATIKRKFEKNKDKNIYVTTFGNNISSPSKNDKAKIEGRKEIKFNLHLNSSQKLTVRYCVIFFDEEGKKIEAIWFDKILSNKAINITGLSKIPDEAKSYKIALKIPNSFKSEITLDYFFATLK